MRGEERTIFRERVLQGGGLKPQAGQHPDETSRQAEGDGGGVKRRKSPSARTVKGKDIR